MGNVIIFFWYCTYLAIISKLYENLKKKKGYLETYTNHFLKDAYLILIFLKNKFIWSKYFVYTKVCKVGKNKKISYDTFIFQSRRNSFWTTRLGIINIKCLESTNHKFSRNISSILQTASPLLDFANLYRLSPAHIRYRKKEEKYIPNDRSIKNPSKSLPTQYSFSIFLSCRGFYLQGTKVSRRRRRFLGAQNCTLDFSSKCKPNNGNTSSGRKDISKHFAISRFVFDVRHKPPSIKAPPSSWVSKRFEIHYSV